MRGRPAGSHGSAYARYMLDDSRYLDVLAHDIAVLSALETDALDAPVPACPEWTVTDLLAHVGRVYHRLDAVLTKGADFAPLDRWLPTPSGGDAVPWFRSTAAALLATLRAADPEAVVPFWAGPSPTRIWFRRMAQETSIHRVDAQQAVAAAIGGAEPGPVLPDVALDGIDELFTLFVPRLPAERWDGLAVAAAESDGHALVDGEASIHLHCTDVEGEWMLRFNHAGLTVANEHAKGDVAARGDAGTMNLVLWNRHPGSTLDCFGTIAVLDRFLAVAHF